MQHVTELNQSMVESLMHHQGQGVPHHTQGPPAVRAKLQGAHAAVQRGTRHKRSQTAQTGAGCGAAMSQSQGCSVAATCLQSGGAYVAGVHRLQVWGPVREKGLPDAPQGSRLLEVLATAGRCATNTQEAKADCPDRQHAQGFGEGLWCSLPACR